MNKCINPTDITYPVQIETHGKKYTISVSQRTYLNCVTVPQEAVLQLALNVRRLQNLKQYAHNSIPTLCQAKQLLLGGKAYQLKCAAMIRQLHCFGNPKHLPPVLLYDVRMYSPRTARFTRRLPFPQSKFHFQNQYLLLGSTNDLNNS